MSPDNAIKEVLEYMNKRLGSESANGGLIIVTPDGRVGKAYTTERMAWASIV